MAKRTERARTRRKVEVPRPGRPVRGSASGRPIMAALDLLGRRWVLRILWELRSGPVGFRELRERCEAMSPDTLSTRLTELEAAGLASSGDDDWALTKLGRKLDASLESLDRWAREWAKALEGS